MEEPTTNGASPRRENTSENSSLMRLSHSMVKLSLENNFQMSSSIEMRLFFTCLFSTMIEKALRKPVSSGTTSSRLWTMSLATS
jgi:hypothetical protein